jgi:hypothetical protein
MPNTISLAKLQADRLRDALHDYRIGPVSCDRERAVIWGVTDKGVFVDGMTADAFLARAGTILTESGRVYTYGNSIVYEVPRDGDGALATLSVEGRAEPGAAHVLENLFVTAFDPRNGPVQSLPATKLVGALLADESLTRRLPKVQLHARRPTFDRDFVLCSPGWNPGADILVHGPEIAPVPWAPGDAPSDGAADRLPPRLRELLGEFSWRSDADLVNAVAVLLTGLLVNHFLDDPHPAAIVDGNQPQLGKTLLVQTIAWVLDDAEPARIPLTKDEEVEKRLCAQVRSTRSTMFFFDNVRARIESVVLEQNVLSPTVSFRVLGKSTIVERPNAFLWMITSNLTAGTPDFISRGVPIRLFYEGDPRARCFTGDPIAYAARHRLGILGELAGMVQRWVEQGRPEGSHRHRCRRWAATIGGILEVAGLGGHFLGNVAEAEAAMDQSLLDLATLAEHVVKNGQEDLYLACGVDPSGKGKPAGHWADVAGDAGVLRDKLAECSGEKARATLIGTFLGGKVGRTVSIEAAEAPCQATLRKREGRGRVRAYYEVALKLVPFVDHTDARKTNLGTAGAWLRACRLEPCSPCLLKKFRGKCWPIPWSFFRRG